VSRPTPASAPVEPVQAAPIAAPASAPVPAPAPVPMAAPPAIAPEPAPQRQHERAGSNHGYAPPPPVAPSAPREPATENYPGNSSSDDRDGE
jgi:translation initiation factor IF-2